MKKTLGLMLAIMILTASAFAQVPSGYAYRIRPVTALPAVCSVANGEVVSLTTGGVTSLQQCLAANTWSQIGLNSIGAMPPFTRLVSTQGAITASLPVLTNTATWNNAAITFDTILVDITDTASNVSSRLIELKVGGASIFNVIKSGSVTIQGGMTAGVGASFAFAGRTLIRSSADGGLNFTNNAGNNFTSIGLGPLTVAFPRIAVSAAVGGQSQGIIITKGDGNAAVFADLGAATNGSMIYCSDCTVASPCAGGGTGAIAKRLNGAWVCN